MSNGDLRALLDPIAALLAARPRYREVPATVYQPPPDEDGELPPPVTVPARTELYVDPAELPDVVSPDGEAISLAAQVALVHSMLAWIWDEMQLRSVAAQHILATGPYLTGHVLELDLTWTEPPAATPTSAQVSINAPIAWLGRTTASVKPGSVTALGCTIVVQVLNTISPNPSNPIVYDAQGTYFWVPPYEPGEP